MKICEACGVNPATVPDRNRMGRPIKRICRECHSKRLAGDVVAVFESFLGRKLGPVVAAGTSDDEEFGISEEDHENL